MLCLKTLVCPNTHSSVHTIADSRAVGNIKTHIMHIFPNTTCTSEQWSELIECHNSPQSTALHQFSSAVVGGNAPEHNQQT